jgi:acetoin utilization protein AcuB
MAKNVETVREDEIIEVAASHMYFHDLDALPVVDKDGQLVAIVTQNDVFRTLVSLMGLRAKGTRITLEVPDNVGVLADITGTVAKMGISIASMSTNIPPGEPGGMVILRVKTGEVEELVKKLAEKYGIVHVSQMWE